MSCNDPQKHFEYATKLYQQGKLENAEKEIREVLELEPDYPAAHYNLGILLKEQKRYDEAEKAYREAIRLRPDYPDAHNNLGILLYEQTRYDEAEKAYREAIRLRPDYPAAHNNLGVLLKEQKRYDEAEKAYREAIRLRPDYHAAHNNLGVLLKGQKKYDEAEREFEMELKLNKDFWQAMWGLSEVHAEMASKTRDLDVYQDALTEINNALRTAVKSPGLIGKDSFLDMYLLRGYIHSALGNYVEAKWDYEECRKYDETNLKVHRNLRRINRILGEKASRRWVRIPLLAVSGSGLLATCIAYFWLGEFNAAQFYAFASASFAFIILGILLPLVRRVKVGRMEMEFEPGKATITTPSITVER